VNAIAGRGSAHYCQKHHKTIADAKRNSEDRYDAVNVMEKTVEFRIFKGTVVPDKFFARLEFCAAILEYLTTCSIQSVEDNGAGFCKWLESRPKSYPALSRFLRAKGLMRKPLPFLPVKDRKFKLQSA